MKVKQLDGVVGKVWLILNEHLLRVIEILVNYALTCIKVKSFGRAIGGRFDYSRSENCFGALTLDCSLLNDFSSELVFQGLNIFNVLLFLWNDFCNHVVCHRLCCVIIFYHLCYVKDLEFTIRWRVLFITTSGSLHLRNINYFLNFFWLIPEFCICITFHCGPRNLLLDQASLRLSCLKWLLICHIAFSQLDILLTHCFKILLDVFGD